MHWLDIPKLYPSNIQDVLNLAEQLKQSGAKRSLQGKTFILAFMNSKRELK